MCCYLFVDLCKLVQVVFKKGNLLFLGDVSASIIRLHLCTLSIKKGDEIENRIENVTVTLDRTTCFYVLSKRV